MGIIKQLEAKEKARSVIKSCWNYLHINTANTYIELYFNKFEDEIGRQELLIELEKRVTLLWGK